MTLPHYELVNARMLPGKVQAFNSARVLIFLKNIFKNYFSHYRHANPHVTNR
jgi:hypothetical protein